MQNNIHKISERGERLDNLQDKTDHLSTQANSFRRGANRVRKQMWWKDMKMRMCIIIGIIILLVVIIVPSGKLETADTGRHVALTWYSNLRQQALSVGMINRNDDRDTKET